MGQISACVLILMAVSPLLLESSFGTVIHCKVYVRNTLPSESQVLHFKFLSPGGSSNTLNYYVIPHSAFFGVYLPYKANFPVHFYVFLGWTAKKEDEYIGNEVIKYGFFDLFNTTFVPYSLLTGFGQYVWHARDFGIGLYVDRHVRGPHYAVRQSWITTSRREYERRVGNLAHPHSP